MRAEDLRPHAEAVDVLPVVDLAGGLGRRLDDRVAQVHGELPDVNEGVLVGGLRVEGAEVDDARGEEHEVLQRVAVHDAARARVREVHGLEAVLDEGVGQAARQLAHDGEAEQGVLLRAALVAGRDRPDLDEALEELRAELGQAKVKGEQAVQLLQRDCEHRRFRKLAHELQQRREVALHNHLVLPPVGPLVGALDAGLRLGRLGGGLG